MFASYAEVEKRPLAINRLCMNYYQMIKIKIYR